MRKSIPRTTAVALLVLAAGVSLAAMPSGHGGRPGCESKERGQGALRDEAAEGDQPGMPGRARRPHGPPPLHRILERHAEQLGLDEATLDGIHAIALEVRDDTEARHEALRAAHDALRALAETPDATQAQFETAAREIGEAEAAIAVLHATTAQRMFALLTPQQREAVSELAPPRPPRDGEEGQGRR